MLTEETGAAQDGPLSTAFNALVRNARGMFPAETAKVDFISSRDRDAKKRVWRATLRDIKSPFWRILGRLFDPFGINAMFRAGDTFAGDNYILMNKSVLFSTRFTFYHELGHILIPARFSVFALETRQDGGVAEKEQRALLGSLQVPQARDLMDENIGECQADVFACVMGLRGGWMTAEDIKTVAGIRALGPNRDDRHVTATALQALLTECGPQSFKDWTPQQVVNFARDFGLLYAPSGSEIACESRRITALACQGPNKWY